MTTETKPVVTVDAEYAKHIYHGLFSDRDTVDRALIYVNKLLQSVPKEHHLVVWTAVHVVLNTVAKHIDPSVDDAEPGYFGDVGEK